jgi:hypothetical protein
VISQSGAKRISRERKTNKLLQTNKQLDLT